MKANCVLVIFTMLQSIHYGWAENSSDIFSTFMRKESSYNEYLTMKRAYKSERVKQNGNKETELLVKYSTKIGLMNACKHGKLFKDMETIHVASVMVKEDIAKEMCMKMMEEDGVEMVEMNFQVEAYLPEKVERYQLNEANHFRGNKRRLQGEVVPYGINLVQAPELIASADRSPQQIKICVGKPDSRQLS